jgi:hypothetical protein
VCDLKDSISSLVMSRCSVWCRLVGHMIFGFFFGSIVMYLWISHSISVLKSCGGGCKKVVRCGRLLWDNWFHSHCSLSVLRVAM